MKRILLLINAHRPPFSQFASMFEGLVNGASQFTLDVTDDRNALCDPSDYDAVALYIAGCWRCTRPTPAWHSTPITSK